MVKRADTDQSQLIWIYTVLNKIYLGLTGHGLIISFVENAPFLVLISFLQKMEMMVKYGHKLDGYTLTLTKLTIAIDDDAFAHNLFSKISTPNDNFMHKIG